MGYQDCVHGPRAYKLGLVMGQHIDIIAVYRRHRNQRTFPGQTATRCCSCYISCVGAEIIDLDLVYLWGYISGGVHTADC